MERHTKAKHEILQKYLQAWFPILSTAVDNHKRTLPKASHEILFIDGFAGPGVYADGEPGSPVIAIQAAKEHARRFPIPARMLFIEHRTDRFERLKLEVERIQSSTQMIPNIRAIEPRLGQCDDVLNRMLDEYESKDIQFGPALAFLDQFGYGAVSMDLIRRILRFDRCEVFTYLSYKEMNRWISDEHKADAFTRAFGGEDWRECVNLPERDRRSRLLATYKTALREKAEVKYVVDFLMYDAQGIPLYWLLFCSNSIRGLEEMKKAMWAVDKRGEFKFSDKDNPKQLALFEDSYDDEWLADTLVTRLNRRKMSVEAIKEFVLTETPCYLFKSALKILEKRKELVVIDPPPERRVGDFKDDLRGVKFSKGLL